MIPYDVDLIRKDFPEIYREALRLGFLTVVFTNATLVTEEIADLFEGQSAFPSAMGEL